MKFVELTDLFHPERKEYVRADRVSRIEFVEQYVESEPEQVCEMKGFWIFKTKLCRTVFKNQEMRKGSLIYMSDKSKRTFVLESPTDVANAIETALKE